jgi:hypothetical protein
MKHIIFVAALMGSFTGSFAMESDESSQLQNQQDAMREKTLLRRPKK